MTPAEEQHLSFRDLMQEHNMSMADGLIMRSLMNYPGGLELHIGVRTAIPY